jgi:four helix bundle protein
MKLKSYRELSVWQKGIEITDLVYEATKQFPRQEEFGLGAQMQRSAVSIASNIAEGAVRRSTREYQQACYVALGSCAELNTQLEVARRQRYVTEEQYARLLEALDHEGRMLNRLIQGLRL